MAAYNFQKQFADDVESGEKSHTMRAERVDNWRPKVGMELQLYTGMRSTSCRLLRRAICTKVQVIVIHVLRSDLFDNEIYGADVRIDGQAVDADEFAAADGFKGYGGKANPACGAAIAMAEWIEKTHHAGGWFEGVLISWDPTLPVPTA